MGKAKRKILLIGGGGHCRSVLSALLTAEESVAGIIDMEEYVGGEIFGISIMGTDGDLPGLVGKGYEAIITVGSIRDNRKRAEMFEELAALGFKMGSFAAKTAIIGRDVSIGEGTVVLEGAVVNAGALLGRNCIINTGAIVEHDAVVGDSVHIAPGAVIGGGVTVGDRAFIGAGSTVIQGVTIGPGAAVGVGSSVIEDVSEGVTVVGCPAKVIK